MAISILHAYNLSTNIKINLFVEFKSDIDLMLIVKLIVINRNVLTGVDRGSHSPMFGENYANR